MKYLRIFLLVTALSLVACSSTALSPSESRSCSALGTSPVVDPDNEVPAWLTDELVDEIAPWVATDGAPEEVVRGILARLDSAGYRVVPKCPTRGKEGGDAE